MIEPKPEWLEHSYLIEERLGIMCGLGEPTDRQRQIAKIAADNWMEQQKSKTCSKNSNPLPPSTGSSSATPSVSAAAVASGLNTRSTDDLFAVNATRKHKPSK